MNKSLLQQIWRFALVGVAGYIVNACMVEALAPAMGPIWAQVLAFPVAVTVTWWLNRRYTFGASHRAIHHEWLRFVFSNALGWVANNGAYVWMIFSMPLAYKHPAFAVAVGSLAGMVFNFAMTRQFVFKPSIRKKNNIQNINKMSYYAALVGSGLFSIYLFFYKQFNSNFFDFKITKIINNSRIGADVKFITCLKGWANSRSYSGLLVSMLLAFLYLSWLYPPHFISGTSSYWLAQNEDITQYIAGFHAFVMEPWQWPLLRISSLNWPEGTLATFVDAIPLYALVLKIGLHGTASLFNPYGLWVAICYVLQAVGAWWILREAQSRSWVALASLTVLLLMFPALGHRLGHISLMSHWLILFAYAIYLRSGRIGNLALNAWTTLIIIAFYINIYLFTMVSIIFFSDAFRFQGVSGLGQTAKALALPFVLLLLSMFVTMLPLPEGAGGGESGFGYYSMNILSPFAGGRLLQWPNPTAQEGQWEGFNYLGVAMLALAGYALVLRWRNDKNFFIRHKLLLICLVAATVYALSNRVYLGKDLFVEWYVPSIMKSMTDQFRASGRFFWIVGYGMFIFSVVTVVRFVKPNKAFWLLIVVVVFQWWDLSMFHSSLRATASRPAETHLNPVLWDQYLGKRVKTLYFYPAFRCGKTALLNSLLPTMLYTSERGLNLSTGYIARSVKPCDNYSVQISRSNTALSAYVFVRDEFPDIEVIQALFGGKSGISCSAIDFAYICKPVP